VGRVGFYPDLPPIPVVPGYEVSGRVDAVGASVDTSCVGRDVLAMTRFGGYADVICVPMQQIFAQPPGMSALEAAALPVNYFTAWQLVVVMGGLKPGETVLVHSAGGGVGIAAAQIAKHIGARVIGTASASKHIELRALGVDHLIDYRKEDFEVRAREITDGRGVELILDAIGGDSLRKGYRLLAPTGRLGMFGISSAVTQKERRVLDVLGMLARTPWFQFNPMSLISQQGCLRPQFGAPLGTRQTASAAGASNCLIYGHEAPSSRRLRNASHSMKRPMPITSFRTAKALAKFFLCHRLTINWAPSLQMSRPWIVTIGLSPVAAKVLPRRTRYPFAKSVPSGQEIPLVP